MAVCVCVRNSIVCVPFVVAILQRIHCSNAFRVISHNANKRSIRIQHLFIFFCFIRLGSVECIENENICALHYAPLMAAEWRGHNMNGIGS